MTFYTKIKEFVIGYFPNKEQKEKNKRNLLLLRGFVEGSYEPNDEYMERSKIKEDKKQSENIEDIAKQTDKMISLAGVC
jgi:hypothetical protein